MKQFFVLLFCLALENSSKAQDPAGVAASDTLQQHDSIPQKLTLLQRLNPKRIMSGNLSFVPIPTVGFAPETGFSYGASFNYFFNATKAGDKDSARESFIWLSVSHSTRNQLVIEPNWQVYTRGEKWFTRGQAGYTRFFERLWGFGNNNVGEDDFSDVFYERLYLQGVLGRQVRRNVFLGMRANTSRMFDAVEERSEFATLMPGATESFVNGLGPVFIADRRNHPYNTMAGWYAEASTLFHHRAFGSQFAYNDIQFDVRKYWPMKKGGGSLAVQAVANFLPGDVPWRELTRVGGPNIMRGFFEGRYRGRHLMAAQAEFRQPVGRFLKFAAFIGTAQVGNQMADFSLLHNHRIAGGGGIRILLNRKRQLYFRTDIAFTNDGTRAVYFRLGEAF
mgnify:CR=1 FL=1